MKKKNNIKTPRRKRINREKRLPIAKEWIKSYSRKVKNGGKNITKSYAKWFGVDKLCAITELRMLGVEISAEYEANVLSSIEATIKARKRRRERASSEKSESLPLIESDDYFAYIAGYTSGGAPYGVTHEEWARMEGHEAGENEREEDSDIPF